MVAQRRPQRDTDNAEDDAKRQRDDEHATDCEATGAPQSLADALKRLKEKIVHVFTSCLLKHDTSRRTRFNAGYPSKQLGDSPQ